MPAGQVDWSVSVDHTKYEPIDLTTADVDIIPTLKKLVPANQHITSFYLKATLSGGTPYSNVAWQHAQLFRISSEDSYSLPFQVTLTVDRSLSTFLSF